jgi:hypothetical protein
LRDTFQPGVFLRESIANIDSFGDFDTIGKNSRR